MSANDALSGLTEVLKGLKESNEKLQASLAGAASPADPDSRKGKGLLDGVAPGVRRGENTMGSRGFSLLKFMGLISGQVKKEHASVESEVTSRLQRHYDENGFQKAGVNTFLMPLASGFIAVAPGQEKFAEEMGQLMRAGVEGYDPYTARERLVKEFSQYGMTKALSWLDETTGGALVAPPMFGELIDLLRNNEVLNRAGARMIAMPPNGRITFPRQTAAGTAYWVGESESITESNPTTGDLVLQAKKLGCIVKVPNELFRFSSISVEQFLREDIARVSALRLDKSLLEAVGSAKEPKGLINYAGIGSYTSADPGTVTDGYRFNPADPANMIAAVESVNAQPRAFIMRPRLWATLYNRRADAVTAGDGAGPFVFNIVRDASQTPGLGRLDVGNLHGLPVFKSTQISNARTKGSSSNLTYSLLGDFSEYVIAMSGAMEFMVSTQGDTPFTTDQTWFRATTFVDGAPRHEAAFSLCDQLYESQ